MTLSRRIIPKGALGEWSQDTERCGGLRFLSSLATPLGLIWNSALDVDVIVRALYMSSLLIHYRSDCSCLGP